MKKLDIVFLTSLVTFILFITLVYSTSQGGELKQRTAIESIGKMSTVSLQVRIDR